MHADGKEGVRCRSAGRLRGQHRRRLKGERAEEVVQWQASRRENGEQNGRVKFLDGGRGRVNRIGWGGVQGRAGQSSIRSSGRTLLKVTPSSPVGVTSASP